jgi:hypothetical protein
MGYALLYESMLDSVLGARDRFLCPSGVMAPSQCRLMLGLCDASEVVKERVEFWNDIYGELPSFLPTSKLLTVQQALIFQSWLMMYLMRPSSTW